MKTQATLHCHGFNDRDQILVKSVLLAFGDLDNSIWSYADGTSADLVLVDCDNLLAVRDAARGYLHGKHVIACSRDGVSCDGAGFSLPKPLRPKHVIAMLQHMDQSGELPPAMAIAANDPPTAPAGEDLMMFPFLI